MQYNYRKLQVLYAIKECRSRGLNANTPTISQMIGVDRDLIGISMVRYLDWKYVTRKRVRGVRAMCYKLTKLGVHTLKLYMARYLNGTHLNLLHKPRPCNFKDAGILLPGYEKMRLYDEHNRKDNGKHQRLG